MDSLLSIHDFSCGYPGRFVLKNIGFEMEKGCFMGVIGPNGSGKTTLFRGISGELSPLQGSVRLSGKNLHKMALREKAQHLAVVTQHFDSVNMSVEDYVVMGRLPYRRNFSFFETRDDFRIANEYMDMVGIGCLSNKNMNALSGGEQQLASIARALVQEPDLLLLDEPTSHLDIMHQVQILNLIRRLCVDLGLTILMIIHDLNLAGEYCDSLLMMQNGTIRKKGTPHEVLNFKDIEAVYKTAVVTQTNPVSGKPVVFLVSEQTQKTEAFNSGK
ncbi:MAG: hypothetical protein CSA36_03855 [Draconibacterium sp.]|nr:MAG: hypothetical protein CSA36_03855 [Draconibacterium sp.]